MLQPIFSASWQWLAAHYQWVISGLMLPIIAIWLARRGKRQIELEERIVETYEDDVDDAIAHRSFIRDVIKGAATLWFFAWAFGGEDDE